MLFSSITFLFYFLPLFLFCYVNAGRVSTRNILMLGFSLFFYTWGDPKFLPLILLSIVANWKAATFLTDDYSPKSRKYSLTLALLFNFGMLGVFKYGHMVLGFAESLFSVPNFIDTVFEEVELPIGISFYTFQAVSYLIDVYRGDVKPEKSLVNMGAYIAMFPQLIAGPIVRYSDIRDELKNSLASFDSIIRGAKLFTLGLSMKLILANYFGGLADQVFTFNLTAISAGLAWEAAICYFFQIYFDFNGYSIMAVGLGAMIGFTFPRNFDRPYISQSVTEFWRRWHLSLSTWFRDYLYIPLGGNRRGVVRTYANLMIVFLLCGLWHGASTNFILWGAYYGFFLILERAFPNSLLKIPRPLRHVYLILIVLFGWILFRCETFDQVMQFSSAMLGRNTIPAFDYQIVCSPLWVVMLTVGVIIAAMKGDYLNPPSVKNSTMDAIGYSFLFLASVVLLVIGSYNPFIYFQF